MYYIETVIKNKTIYDSLDLFGKAKSLYGISYSFSMKNFENFAINLFDIYKYNNEIYKYRQDVRIFLEHAIVSNIEKGKKILTLEDISDSIWNVKTNSDKDNCRILSVPLYKIKKMQEEIILRMKI